MSTEFERDLQASRRELSDAREHLLGVVGVLDDADLDRARRGGWTARRVLEHVIWSEWVYGRLIAHLRGLPGAPGEVPSSAPESAADARSRLEASHEALLAALEGVDEESFYRLGTIGHEEYSIISVLENTANHDREHADQIRAILARERRQPPA